MARLKKTRKPENQVEEVLYSLLTRFSIDRRQMMLSCGILNLPDVIMRIRNKLNIEIETSKIPVLNKFGRNVEFGEYKLKDKAHARNVYDNLK